MRKGAGLVRTGINDVRRGTRFKLTLPVQASLQGHSLFESLLSLFKQCPSP